MYKISPRCRLWAGILLIVLGAFVLQGCQNTPPQAAGPSMSFVTSIPDPTAATADDYTRAGAKPANPADAVATMIAPILSVSGGAALASAGTESNLLVDCGNTGASCGSLPLQLSAGQISSNLHAVLPKGDSAFYFSPGTCFDLDDLFCPNGAKQAVRLNNIKVLFSVHGGHSITWTIPSTQEMRIARHGRMYQLDDSFLTLRWNGHLSIPPADNQVKISANLYQGSTLVAGPLEKTVTVQNNTAVFTGNNDVLFNRVDLTIDLRDTK